MQLLRWSDIQIPEKIKKSMKEFCKWYIQMQVEQGMTWKVKTKDSGSTHHVIAVGEKLFELGLAPSPDIYHIIGVTSPYFRIDVTINQAHGTFTKIWELTGRKDFAPAARAKERSIFWINKNRKTLERVYSTHNR